MQFEETIKIEDKIIGEKQPVFVIAEVGVNHDGDIETAKNMIKAAADCGADCVKFQTFNTDEFMSDKQLTYSYEVNGRKITEKMYDMFQRLEIPLDAYEILFEQCRRYGLVPLTSVADKEIAGLMEETGLGAFKLSSEDFINIPLITHVTCKKLPLILSTGMADQEEIEDVLRLLYQFGKRNVVFLHCTSIYPTPDDEANLLRIHALKKKTNAPVGYSDHTKGVSAAIGAVSLGACIIEKHFTLDKSMTGPDHYFSSDPSELAKMVSNIRKMEKILGQDNLKLSPSELQQRIQFRRSIVAARNLDQGRILNENDLVLKRPGNGLHPRNLPKLYGKRLLRFIAENKPLSFEDIF